MIADHLKSSVTQVPVLDRGVLLGTRVVVWAHTRTSYINVWGVNHRLGVEQAINDMRHT